MTELLLMFASRTQSAVKRLQKLSNLPNPNALLMQPVPIWAHILGAEVGRLNHGALLRTISGVVNVFCYRPSMAELANSSPPVRRMFQALAVMPSPQFPQQARLTPGAFREKQLQLLSLWGWPTAAGFVPISQLTVRTATELLTSQQSGVRRNRHKEFCQLAHGLANAAQLPDDQLESLLPNMWRAPCRNTMKEPFWRLTVNGIPTAERRRARRELCGCGACCPDRSHHFWSCPVARSVIRDIQRQLDVFC